MYQRQDLTHAMNGVWLPLITPFQNGRLDEKSLAGLVQHYATTGITGFIALGTTGESMTVSETERDRIVSIIQEANSEHLPVLLGHCGVDTHRLCHRIAETNALPIDGYLVTAPYYVKPPQDGLIEHYRLVAEAADERPVVLYNIPGRTGSNMSNDTALHLASLSNVVAIKDCCGNEAQTTDLIRRAANLRQATGLSFSVFTGNDNTFFDHLRQGGAGGIMASSHIDTEEFIRVAYMIQSGQEEQARPLWDRLSARINLLFRESNPGPVKYWLAEQGLISSPEMRLPMTRISDQLQKDIKMAMAGPSPRAALNLGQPTNAEERPRDLAVA